MEVNSSGKSKEEDDSSSSSSVRNQKKDRSPRIKVSRPMEESFAKAVSYRTYRLKDKSQWYNSKISSKVAKLAKKVRSQLKKTDFDEMDSISILAFLKEFCDACDSIGINERVSMRLVSRYMKRPASSSLEAHLSQKKSMR